jgi:hypothetical protein
VGPVNPVNPAGPVGPVVPVAPAGPVAPVTPVTPPGNSISTIALPGVTIISNVLLVNIILSPVNTGTGKLFSPTIFK